MPEPILTVTNLKRYFTLDSGYMIKALDGVSLSLAPGETWGLVGESGCGKSTLARTIMGVYPPTSGRIDFRGQKMQMVFQDADGALDPLLSAGSSIEEGLRLQQPTISRRELKEQLSELLFQVGLDERCRELLPGELSGGQRQRVALARCLGLRPDLILADEPLASLDVSIQAQIANLLQDLQQQYHFALLFISHDLEMVRHLAPKMAVMYKGRLVESGLTEDIFAHPQHSYTRRLLASRLKIEF